MCKVDYVQSSDGENLKPTVKEQKDFSSFNKLVAKTVNNLEKNPNRKVTIKNLENGQGGFSITSGEAAENIVKRTVIATAKEFPNKGLIVASGGPGTSNTAANVINKRTEEAVKKGWFKTSWYSA